MSTPADPLACSAAEVKRHGGRLIGKDYSVSDPQSEVLHMAMAKMHRALFPEWKVVGAPSRGQEVTISRADALAISAAAQTWIHFGSHPAPDKMILLQLREVRRASRKP